MSLMFIQINVEPLNGKFYKEIVSLRKKIEERIERRRLIFQKTVEYEKKTPRTWAQLTGRFKQIHIFLFGKATLAYYKNSTKIRTFFT